MTEMAQYPPISVSGTHVRKPFHWGCFGHGARDGRVAIREVRIRHRMNRQPTQMGV